MVVKGIISAIDIESKSIDVILPEYDNVVVTPAHMLGAGTLGKLKVNDFLIVVVFNNDFNDTFILLPSYDLG